MISIATEADFARHVTLGQTPESCHLEFKRDLDRWRADDREVRRRGQKEFCRDVSQFANAMGGCLLLGIDETQIDAMRVASRLVGIDDFDARRAWMEQAMQNFLLPAAFGVTIDPVVVNGQSIIAVNVPPSEHLVVLWDPAMTTLQAVRRTNHGKQAMHPNEMEAHGMNSARAAKIAFERVRATLRGESKVDLVSGVWTTVRRTSTGPPSLERVPDIQVTLGAIDEHEFELRVTSRQSRELGQGVPTIRIPYGLLREAWPTAAQLFGIFLHVRIVQQGTGFSLEPF